MQEKYPNRSPSSIAKELKVKYGQVMHHQQRISAFFPTKEASDIAKNQRLLKLIEVFVNHNIPLNVIESEQFRQYHSLLEVKSPPGRKEVPLFF